MAYPLELVGVIVGGSDTCEKASADVKSAILFHAETFGADALEPDFPVLKVFVTETSI